MKAMIFAAGLGTRLKPFTDHHPKALALVHGKTLLQRNIEYFKGAGIRDIIINVHHFADQLVHYVQENRNFDCHISFSHETEAPLETGGGLKKARWFFENEKEPFVVMNVDILTTLELYRIIEFHKTNKPLATLAVTNRPTSRNFLMDEHGILCGWTNQKTGEIKISRDHEPLRQVAFTCVHIIEPAIFPLLQHENKFSILDSYLDLARTQTILCYEHSQDIVVDVGKPESLIQAERFFS